jgi:hypothetical protein
MGLWKKLDMKNQWEIENKFGYKYSYRPKNKHFYRPEKWKYDYVNSREIKSFIWDNINQLNNMTGMDYFYWLDELRRYLRIHDYEVDETSFWILKDFFEWGDISTLPLEEVVIENYSSKLDLYLVVENSRLSKYLLEVLCDEVDLYHILKYQNVDKDFLYNHSHKFTQKEWDIVIKTQQLDSDFIIENLRHLDFNELLNRQEIRNIEIYEEAEKLNINIDWDFVVISQNLNFNMMVKFWDKFDHITQNCIIEHQVLDLRSVDFIASRISQNKCAELLASQLSSKSSKDLDFDKIIIKYILKWIYSKDYENVYKLLKRVAYKTSWIELVQSNYYNCGFLYDKIIKEKILRELDIWIMKLTKDYNPRTKRRAVKRKRLLEALAANIASNFVNIDIL